MSTNDNTSEHSPSDTGKVDCEHCNGPGNEKCCWARAMEIKKFKERVKKKYIIEVIFDLIISTTSVATDIIALILYFYRGKYAFALLTGIPVLLPTFVFTNVYLADESTKKPSSSVVSIISETSKSKRSSLTGEDEEETSWKEKVEPTTQLEGDDRASTLDTASTDSSIRPMKNKGGCLQQCCFHWSCYRGDLYTSCLSGCAQCLCNRDHRLRRRGAIVVRDSLQRLFKYGFGTIVLRFIAWMWHVKALFFGWKAYRQPKKYMHIAEPDTHWSYELLVRLDFLQAALENAPQCVIQLYALITQPDEDVALGILTLTLSFVDFIRVAVSVHWDMHKGPVTAPSGCYTTLVWKFINTSSWVFIYAARSAAISLVLATSGIDTLDIQVLFPAIIFIIHILIFGKLLSRTEYGVAAQKIVVTVFISLFFLPELDSSVLPQIIQFYYATIIIQNSIFVIPWNGFEAEYCITLNGYKETKPTGRPLNPQTTARTTKITYEPPITIRGLQYIMAFPPPITTEEPEEVHDTCLIEPLWITLAVPTMTIFGVIFRLVSSQKMYNYKNDIPEKDLGRNETQNKLQTSISKLFSKNWSQMTAKEMLMAFLKMIRKEVIILDKDVSNANNEDTEPGTSKRFSFLTAGLQADFLASQTFIRESFSLMTRTTRSHEISIGQLHEKDDTNEEEPQEYNSDSELTFRKGNAKKRPRIPRSRNTSESIEGTAPGPQDTGFVQVDLPSGTQYLEMCWI